MKLTQEQEKDYLLDLLFEAARYRDVSMDSPYSAIELEIRDRIQRLNGSEDDTDARWKSMIQQDAKPEIHVETECLEPDDYKALESAYLETHLERAIEKKRKQAVDAKANWKQRNVRVKVNGKTVWKPREQCRQVPRDNSKGGLPWMWRWVGENSATVAENLPTKDEQCEAMWAEHEKEEK